MFSMAALWLSAMGWHLWRILTLRPAYRRLSDSGPTVISFFTVFLVAGLLRWGVLAPKYAETPIWEILVMLVAYSLVLLMLFSQKRRSDALVAVLLGVSAGVDLLICVGFLLGLLPSVETGAIGGLVELGLSLVAVGQFLREPDVVRQAGYKASEHPELTRSV